MASTPYSRRVFAVANFEQIRSVQKDLISQMCSSVEDQLGSLVSGEEGEAAPPCSAPPISAPPCSAPPLHVAETLTVSSFCLISIVLFSLETEILVKIQCFLLCGSLSSLLSSFSFFSLEESSFFVEFVDFRSKTFLRNQSVNFLLQTLSCLAGTVQVETSCSFNNHLFISENILFSSLLQEN